MDQGAELVSSPGFRALDRLTKAVIFSGWTPFPVCLWGQGTLETQWARVGGLVGQVVILVPSRLQMGSGASSLWV